MNEVKTPKKPLIYYYVIVLLVLMLFNWLVSPALFSPKIEEVDYGVFLSMAEDKNLSEVQVTDTEIVFADNGQPPKFYKTGRMNDIFLATNPQISNAIFFIFSVFLLSPLSVCRVPLSAYLFPLIEQAVL